MKFELSRLRRSMALRISLLLFAALNLGSWVRYRYFPAAADQQTSFGFPFPVFISGGIEGAADFYLLGLLLDIAVALTLAVLVTWIAELFRP
jgi:hypothetical protein